MYGSGHTAASVADHQLHPKKTDTEPAVDVVMYCTGHGCIDTAGCLLETLLLNVGSAKSHAEALDWASAAVVRVRKYSHIPV